MGTERIQNGYKNENGMGTERVQNGYRMDIERISNGYGTVMDQKKREKSVLERTLLENAFYRTHASKRLRYQS